MELLAKAPVLGYVEKRKRQRQRGATMGSIVAGALDRWIRQANVAGAGAAADAKGPASYGAEGAARLRFRSRRVQAERPKTNRSVKFPARCCRNFGTPNFRCVYDE